MKKEKHALLPGSERAAARNITHIGSVPEEESISVTLVLRRKAELPDELIHSLRTVGLQELVERYGSAPSDTAAVVEVLGQFGLHAVEDRPGSRRIQVRGTAKALSDAFQCELSRVAPQEGAEPTAPTYRYRTGPLSVPAELDGIVTAVLGLDDRPQAEVRPRLVRPLATSPARYYTPVQLGQIYNFPSGTSGTGQRLAIISLGGGLIGADLSTYFSSLGLRPPAVLMASTDGAVNAPTGDPAVDGEVVLDVEVAGALANNAQLLVYFGQNTDRGFFDAVYYAVHSDPSPTAISISWGKSEDSWTAQARNAMNQVFADAAALGITVTAASGDQGSSDGDPLFFVPHVDFPASSPYVLACGGTRLTIAPATGTISETVWNNGTGGGATGGGASNAFPAPAWQSNVPLPRPGRGVPDVAAVADPETGYLTFTDGQYQITGGTSAVAPLWAALVCRLAEALGRPFGLLQPLVYPKTAGTTAFPGFRDITKGDNGAYSAAPGWDPCTGLGVPDGQALLEYLRRLV